MEKLTRVAAIKRFFEAEGGRKVTMSELKNLTNDDKQELGNLAAVELGCEIVESK